MDFRQLYFLKIWQEEKRKKLRRHNRLKDANAMNGNAVHQRGASLTRTLVACAARLRGKV